MNLNDEAKGRRYSRSDYAPLDSHYKAKVNQVHVVNEYAQLSQESMKVAIGLGGRLFQVGQWSASTAATFGADGNSWTWPPANSPLPASSNHWTIRTNKPSCAPQPTATCWYWAGPGSGKTKVVVHRCAYLTRVERVPPFSILILCFKPQHFSGTAPTPQGPAGRRRAVHYRPDLPQLGPAPGRPCRVCRKVTQSTAGIPSTSDKMIAQATALLTGKSDVPGIPDDQLRERLLAGFQYILVDEYQDIDAPQYEMISAIAGRTIEESDDKLSIMAVGGRPTRASTHSGGPMSGSSGSLRRTTPHNAAIWSRTTDPPITSLRPPIN